MRSGLCLLAFFGAVAAQVTPPNGLYQTPSIGGSGAGQQGSGISCGGSGGPGCGSHSGTGSHSGGSGCGGPGQPRCGGSSSKVFSSSQQGGSGCGGPGQPGCGGSSSTVFSSSQQGGSGCGGPGQPGCGGSSSTVFSSSQQGGSGCGGPGQPGCGSHSGTGSHSGGSGCGGPGQPGCGSHSGTGSHSGGRGCGGPGQPGCGSHSGTGSHSGGRGCGGPGQPGCGGSSSTVFSSSQQGGSGCSGPGQPGCGGSSSTVFSSSQQGCGGPGQPGCGGSFGGSGSVDQNSVVSISNDYIPPRQEQSSGSSFVGQSINGRPSLAGCGGPGQPGCGSSSSQFLQTGGSRQPAVQGGIAIRPQGSAFNRRPNNDFLNNPSKYSNQQFSNPPRPVGGSLGPARKTDYSSNVFLGSPSLAQTVRRPGLLKASVSTQSGVSQGGSISQPGRRTSFVSSGVSNGIASSSRGTGSVSARPSGTATGGQRYQLPSLENNNNGFSPSGSGFSAQPLRPRPSVGAGSGLQNQILRLNVNPGSGNSGPLGHQLGTCSSSLVCVPEAMCNPYTGFVRGGLLYEPDEPSDLPTVALDRCSRLKDGGAGDGVCCQMPHINDPWPRDQ